VQAAKDMNLELIGSYMVGDQARDMTAGKSVGCTTLHVGGASLLDQQLADTDHSCANLVAAVSLIVQFENQNRRLDDPSIRMGTRLGKFGKPGSRQPITS
jgi:histidinol phosphatase-like enzyme